MVKINIIYIILLALTLSDFGINVSLAGVDGTWK